MNFEKEMINITGIELAGVTMTNDGIVWQYYVHNTIDNYFELRDHWFAISHEGGMLVMTGDINGDTVKAMFR